MLLFGSERRSALVIQIIPEIDCTTMTIINSVTFTRFYHLCCGDRDGTAWRKMPDFLLSAHKRTDRFASTAFLSP